MAQTSSVTITYVATTGEEAGSDLSLELDSARNQEVYGVSSKTTFAPGEVAYLKLLTTSNEPYTIECSYGSARRQASDIPYPITENLTFANETEATLAHLPMGSVTWDWIGNNAGEPLFTNREVIIVEPDVAVLHCEYDTLGDRLRLLVSHLQMLVSGYDEISVVVFVSQGSNSASVTVTYKTEEGGGGEPVPVDLEVADFCDQNTLLEGVLVYVDGVEKGQTNQNGRLYIGDYVPGSEHTLTMTKTDYRDSDSDPLANDLFTVPSS